MQSILNCIRIAIQNINDYNKEKTKFEITTPDVVSTIYRLIYLSNVSIAFQALSLLLQLVLVQNEKHDRFYNALYRKMLDPDIHSANSKITSLYFHIIHRSIHQDSNVPRCKAFLKRLLQMTLSFAPPKACGALIVIGKILKERPELRSFHLQDISTQKVKTEKEAKFKKYESNSDDDDGEEQFKDVKLDELVEKNEHPSPAKQIATSSWVHTKHSEAQKVENDSHQKAPTKYDPFKRSAAYSGAEFSIYYELVLMSKCFHPTVQVFVQDILKSQKFKYYGDPLKDFSLSHFLERFSFKNPKKPKEKEEKSAFNRAYQAKGSRGLSVYSLTEQSCTEDERFIFDFIQKKREVREQKAKASEKEDENDDLESINDDEFDDYLDSLGAKKDYDASEKDFDYLNELQNDKSRQKSMMVKNKLKNYDSDDEWDDDAEEDLGSDDELAAGSEGESGTDLSIDDDDDEEVPSDSEEEKDMKPKKSKKSKDKDNLFVAVDDFSEIIEKNASSKHGTLGEIFNKDKSSQKQLDWEDKRHNKPSGGFKRKNLPIGKKSFGPKKRKFK
jgi:ribosome biogenesis protein MAK21